MKYLNQTLALKLIVSLIIIIGHFPKANGQKFDTLNVNNVSALIHAQGDLFWDLIINPHFEVPKGENKHTIFAASVWVGGFDQGNNLYMAANTYRQTGDDFWAGPLSTEDASISQSTSEQWNKVWKITRKEVQDHVNGTYTSDAIINWPAHGDTSLGQAYYLAPFVDVSGNGKYEPQAGDYPKIKGDMMLWWIFNDNLATHTESGGLPLGIEIHGTAFAYIHHDEYPALPNTVFFEYIIHNRSQNTYQDLYVGKWVDIDIGYPNDDYIGSIPELNSFYGYNGVDYDPEVNGYGNNPPMQSITFLDKSMSHFIAYENNFSHNGNPTQAIHYYNYLIAHWKNGDPLCWGGDGFGDCWSYPPNINFMYPSDPQLPRGNNTNWSEVSANNTPGDRRGVGSIGPYTFSPNEKIKFTLAYIYQRTNFGGNTGAYDLMKNNINQIQTFFDNENIDSIFIDTTFNDTTTSSVYNETQNLKFYPNPIDDILYINIENSFLSKLYIYNSLGQKILQIENINSSYMEVPVAILPEGIYFIKIKTNKGLLTEKLIISR